MTTVWVWLLLYIYVYIYTSMCNRLLCLKKVEAKTKEWQHVATKASGCGWCVPERGTAWRLVRREGQKEVSASSTRLTLQTGGCPPGRDNEAGLFRLENLQLFRSIWLLFHIEMTSWPRGEFIEVLSRFFGKHWKKPAVLVRCHRPNCESLCCEKVAPCWGEDETMNFNWHWLGYLWKFWVCWK